MKLLLLPILISLATLSAFADDARLVIKQKSGNETVVQLAFNPVITFSSEDMIVSSDLTTIYIPLSDMDHYKVYDGTSSIRPLKDAPKFANGHVVFSGLVEGTVARVYNVDGRLVGQQSADASGHADISLERLPKGVYIVSTPNNSSIKIVKK